MPDAKRGGFGSADDHMIQKVDVDGSRRFADLSGDVHVWALGAGGVIVDAGDCGRGLADGGPEYLRGCARAAVAVPKVTSTCFRSRFFLLRPSASSSAEATEDRSEDRSG